MIVGGPPCQGFSISGKRNIDDPRNGYYRSFFQFVRELAPKAFLMENVPNLIGMGQGKYKDLILDLLKLLDTQRGIKYFWPAIMVFLRIEKESFLLE